MEQQSTQNEYSQLHPKRKVTWLNTIPKKIITRMARKTNFFVWNYEFMQCKAPKRNDEIILND